MIARILALVALLVAVAGCGGSSTSSTSAGATAASSAPHACHYRKTGTDPLMVRQDHRCTPGVTNPDVTQANLASTACKTGWTATVRPPLSVTSKIKDQSLKDYGLPASAAATTELDHLIPLELGGAPADPKNLWVEPNYPNGPHPTRFDHNPKDVVEFRLRNAVCAGRVPLAAAQKAIATNWTTALVVTHLVTPSPSPSK